MALTNNPSDPGTIGGNLAPFDRTDGRNATSPWVPADAKTHIFRTLESNVGDTPQGGGEKLQAIYPGGPTPPPSP